MLYLKVAGEIVDHTTRTLVTGEKLRYAHQDFALSVTTTCVLVGMSIVVSGLLKHQSPTLRLNPAWDDHAMLICSR
ncbi:hypothetical protein BDZ85DRAFT_269146 [Elsinoe ampelina]|uniref:Uncharacterized protein n=1 Tax=Elsinoe ampelina TaxID=302913 RepID=A0A6A6G0H7_9PEZI|nr:hypothetical protein BDZ85DRAFT_269146 [Elsinoe ampelina]